MSLWSHCGLHFFLPSHVSGNAAHWYSHTEVRLGQMIYINTHVYTPTHIHMHHTHTHTDTYVHTYLHTQVYLFTT